MKCPYCNCELQEGSKFCDKCGQEIPNTAGVSQVSKNYWEDYQAKASKNVSAYQSKIQKENDAQKAKRNKIILAILASACAIALIIYMTVIHPAQQYSKAIVLLDSGKFHEAIAVFEDLEDYKDSEEMIIMCQEGITEQRYQDGLAKYKNGDYEDARLIFMELGSYKACQSFLHECNLQIGWEIESNNSSQKATIISLNKEHFGSLESDYNSEQDWYRFSLEAPGRVVLIFNTENQSSDDAYWDVSIRSQSNPEGYLWQEYIDGNATRTESLSLSLPAGTYYFEVESSNQHSSDPYSFEVVYSDEQTIADIPDGAFTWDSHSYAVFDNCTSWEEAKEYCESSGGHLATITSNDENAAIHSFMKQSGYESAYFGLSDSIEEGNWSWVTGESVAFINWHSGEPNGESSTEDYAMFYYKYSDGTWNDGEFGNGTTNGGTAFICEWD